MRCTNTKTYFYTRIEDILRLGEFPSMDTDKKEAILVTNIIALSSTICSFCLTLSAYFIIEDKLITFNCALFCLLSISVLYLHFRNYHVTTRIYFASMSGLLSFYYSCVVDHDVLGLNLLYLSIGVNSVFVFTYQERKWAFIAIFYAVSLLVLDSPLVNEYLPCLHRLSMKDKINLNYLMVATVAVHVLLTTFLIAQRKLWQNPLVFNMKEEGITHSNTTENKTTEPLEQDKILAQRAAQGEGIISNIAQLQLNTEEDWNFLQLHFDKQNQDFSTQFLKKYPFLTHNDVRLAILMKLNLGTKEIAQILGVSVSAIHKSRYRLKKKLNLGEGDDLLSFLHSFNTL